ncbi:MAG: manganese efflux pump [Clostridia bacterium]|nr:manganese efflux pump [Clostridia bacterium]
MFFEISFIVNSILLGVGLAMDAFSVSLANGLNEPCMKKRRQILIAGTFAFFQFIMPLIGWFCVHNLARLFSTFEKLIPFIALGLLLFIGGKMLIDGIKGEEAECENKALCFSALMVQGVATSIDALSVGFTISDYNTVMALGSSLIIAVVTFIICIGGLILGKTIGTRLSEKSSILGGIILILIGIEIFLKGLI